MDDAGGLGAPSSLDPAAQQQQPQRTSVLMSVRVTTVAPPFMPAQALSAAFYQEAVAPMFVGHAHAAALLGWGSDVLGYDTQQSTDHGWGPRLLVFLPPSEAEQTKAWTTRLDEQLPQTFRGWPVRYGWDATPTQHWVTVTTLAQWTQDHLGVDATSGLTTLDWLTIPQQRLLGVVGGAVHADHDRVLEMLRRELAWYPEQVWFWLLACQWTRVAQEEAFVARGAQVGDEAGSATTAARQAREIMRLALLLQKRYAPYQKWLGTAFRSLLHTDDLPAQLRAALHAPDSERRQAHLAEAYRSVAHRHNAAGITPLLDPRTRRYHGRPAQVLMAERFAAASLEAVHDPWLRSLPLVGAVDQFVDSSDVLANPVLWRRAASVYGPASPVQLPP